MTTLQLVLVLVWAFFSTCSTQDADHFTIKFEDNMFELINMTDYDRPLNACNFSKISNHYPNYGNFLSADLRISLCEKVYEVLHQKFPVNFYPKCFEEQTLVKRNPCAIVCINKQKRSEDDDTRDCKNVADTKNKIFFLTGAQCGEHHFCDMNGCCVDETSLTISTTTTTPPTTTPPTPPTSPIPSTPPTSPISSTTPTPPNPPTPPTTTPSTPPTPPTSPIPSTPPTSPIPSTTPNPTNPPTPPTTTHPTPANLTISTPTTTPPTPPPTPKPKPVPTKRHVCDRPGYSIFKENRLFYFFCKFYATIHHCGTNNKFNAVRGHCEYDRSTPDPALEFEKWRDAVKCPIFNTYIRSPYDCKYYYTCEKDAEHGQRIFYNFCPGGLVFNETSQSCDYKTKKCNNRLEVP